MEKEFVFRYMTDITGRMAVVREAIGTLEAKANEEHGKRNELFDNRKGMAKEELKRQLEVSQASESDYRAELNVYSHELKALRSCLCKASMYSLNTFVLENKEKLTNPIRFKKFKSEFEKVKFAALAPIFESSNVWRGETYNHYTVDVTVLDTDYSRQYTVSYPHSKEEERVWGAVDNEGKLDFGLIEAWNEKLELPDLNSLHELAKEYIEEKNKAFKRLEEFKQELSATMNKYSIVRDHSCFQENFYI